MKDAAYLALLLLFFGLSGERERDLRLRLESERAFAESLAQEADWMTNSLAQVGKNKPELEADSIRAGR